jgi:hypothetical protein
MTAKKRGKPLTEADISRCVRRGKELGIAREDIAAALGVTVEALDAADAHEYRLLEAERLIRRIYPQGAI